MITRKRMMGPAIACVAVGVFFVTASASASADDGRLTVTPAVYRTDSSTSGPTIRFVRYGRGRGWSGGYGWHGYGYRPYYRPYFYGGYPAYGYGYGYPAYGYGYPGYVYGYRVYGYPGYGYGYPSYGYGYPGYGFYYYGPGVGVW